MSKSLNSVLGLGELTLARAGDSAGNEVVVLASSGRNLASAKSVLSSSPLLHGWCGAYTCVKAWLFHAQG